MGGESDEEELELDAAHRGGAPVGEVGEDKREDERQDGEDDEGWGCQWGSAGRFCKDRQGWAEYECVGIGAGLRRTHRHPQCFPDDRHVVFRSWRPRPSRRLRPRRVRCYRLEHYLMSVRISLVRLRGESMIDAPQWMTRLTTSYVEKKSDELGNRLVKYGGSPLYSCAKKRLHWGSGACRPERVSGVDRIGEAPGRRALTYPVERAEWHVHDDGDGSSRRQERYSGWSGLVMMAMSRKVGYGYSRSGLRGNVGSVVGVDHRTG